MKSRHRNSIASLATVLLLSIINLPYAVASTRGEQLYNNHCQQCHNKTVHTRTDSRVTSIESLRAWVVAWSVHNGLFWGNEEVSDITAYLNRTIYHFTD